MGCELRGTSFSFLAVVHTLVGCGGGVGGFSARQELNSDVIFIMNNGEPHHF